MIQQLLLVLLFSIIGYSAQPSRGQRIDVRWSVHPAKTVFQLGEPITLSYELENRSGSKIVVPRSINPYMSVRFGFHDPTGRQMKWNGAHYSFRYTPADFIAIEPGEKVSGLMQVPAVCPHAPAMEKAGYCFERKGVYTGTAEFKLGENAMYRREEVHGRLAEGPYVSQSFTFSLR